MSRIPRIAWTNAFSSGGEFTPAERANASRQIELPHPSASVSEMRYVFSIINSHTRCHPRRHQSDAGQEGEPGISGGVCPHNPGPVAERVCKHRGKRGRSSPQEAEGEDRVFLMTLLYTGGRAQFYGLMVGELDFSRGEITTDVKGGKVITIPLHPKLARVLKKHLASRGYPSRWLFRNGKDVSALRGQRANRQNAWRICKRVQRQAGIEESVHPHRFRKTLAAYVRQTGLDPRFLQAILAHAHLSRTLEEYTQVELEDLKRQFARLDPINGYGSSASSSTEAIELLERLRGLGPDGLKHAWEQLVDGLLGLIAIS